ncbi:MAG: TlpA disulfide reductase family protein [Pseudomonadota bacterium]
MRIKLFSALASFFFVFSLNADEGKLFDEYPPNVVAENFALPDLQGDKHRLEEFRGKFVLVNFWSMSCNVCKSEMTTLQSAYELIDSDELAIVSIHAGNNFDGVEDVLALNRVSYTVLFDTALQLGEWGIPILPTTFIVDPDGNIRFRAVGTRIWNSPFMIDFLQSLLDSDASQAVPKQL